MSSGVLLGCRLRYPVDMIRDDEPEDYSVCPHCGAELASSATFCSECGSSDADGWSEEVDVGGEDFDYDAYVANNFSESRASTEVKTEWRWVAIGMLLMFLLACLAALG